MPILDPSFVFYLLRKYVKQEENEAEIFLPYLLKNAAENLNHSPESIEASVQFKKDFLRSQNIIDDDENFFQKTKLFKDFSSINFTHNRMIRNYIRFLYDQLKDEYKTKELQLNGFYSTCVQYDFSIFQPITFDSNVHAWFFSENPIAILCIDLDELSSISNYFFYSINLEIDLIAASGFMIVLCINLDKKTYVKNIDEIIYLMTNHPFSEIHLSSYKIDDEDFYIKFLCGFNEFSNYPHIYIYTSFNNIESSQHFQSELQSKYLGLYPNFQFIQLSKHPKNAFKTIKVFNSHRVDLCTNGFDFKDITILLSNIPVYKSKNDLVPNLTSGICSAKISKHDFLYLKNERAKIDLSNLSKSYYVCYACFEDIHLIRPDFYVKKTLYLTNISENNLKIISKLVKEINNSSFKEKNYDSNFAKMFKDKNMLECIKNSVLAYTYIEKQKNQKFSIHNAQLLTILNTCEEFIFREKINDHNGIVYQVDTGEGKSCIVQIIAAVLSSMGNTVHIVSSNIELSNRDYFNSMEFFDEMNQNSAVLLHKNEKSNKDEYKDKYPEEYFNDKFFENSLNMNINVCDKNSNVKIIFSTLANFQYYYLWMMGKYPGAANQYFNSCCLLIDEADSILIDEISNGAILSHSVRSNAAEVLTYIYSQRKSLSPEEMLENVKEKYSNCEMLTLDDIIDMYNEIDIVNAEDFSNGRKYRLEKVLFEEGEDLLDLYKKYRYDSFKLEAKNSIKNIVKQFKNKKDKTKSTDSITLKRVVPFDSENKGMSEKNKEFSGYIQQFIAIKEKAKENKNENLIIQNLSMNYLYVSHPFFINLYQKGVCGFTGTIGNEYEFNIYGKTYSLSSKKIPRENANHRVDLPKIICKEKEEKKKKIFDEIMKYNEKEYPVLVIFQNSKELTQFKKYLREKGIKNIYVFNGKDESFKPDEIAGKRKAISIGTNICGRGVDIKIHKKPLHVIIAYYTSNARIIEQALGRTARQGHKGSSRIICSVEEYLASKIIFEPTEINKLLNIFEIKKNIQISFIEHFRQTRKWIFSDLIEKQTINHEDVGKMRDSLINVNRCRAYNYEFPICMKVETFLKIQAQKIFSLYNLPNCKNTWMIFQRYIREMLFYSLSLTIENVDKEYRLHEKRINYQNYLDNKIKELKELLELYLPEDDPSKMNVFHTYMNIYEIVDLKYSNCALNVIPEWLKKINKQSDGEKFISFSFGFRPYSVGDSTDKIDTINGENQNCYTIQDPELKFYQQKPGQKKIKLSITKKVDQIFNEMCNKINELINNTIGLNFFLRRTLGGCEFGVCYDLGIENEQEDVSKYDFLVDKDPLFLFSINVRSSSNAPILAGVLIFCLVYIANVTKNIFELITNPSKAFLKTIKAIVENLIEKVKEAIEDKIKEKIAEIVSEKVATLFDPIEQFLIGVIEKQINKLDNNHSTEAFTRILSILTNDNFSDFSEKINGFFEGKTILKAKAISLTADFLPMDRFFKLGVLLILCISSFMMNFHSRCKRVRYDEGKVAKKFNDDQDINNALKDNSYILTADDLVHSSSSIQFQIGEETSKEYLLEVTIIQAEDVPKMDIIGWCDPYVIVKNTLTNEEICETHYIKNTKAPIWNYKFEYKFDSKDYYSEALTFKMVDFDENSKYDFISSITIPMNTLQVDTPVDNWYDMIPGKRAHGKGGKLRISFLIKPLD